MVEDISLLSAKLVGFKCCFAEWSLLVSEQIPNVAYFKLCPSGGFVSGNRLMTFWHETFCIISENRSYSLKPFLLSLYPANKRRAWQVVP